MIDEKIDRKIHIKVEKHLFIYSSGISFEGNSNQSC